MGVESVLLYYKYVDLAGRQGKFQQWFLENCTQLGLVGRVRIARDGINVTVGGNHKDLLTHIEDVKQCPAFGSDIDFKLAKSVGPESTQATVESRFDGLQVSICKEVVSLGDGQQCPPDELPQRTGQHLSPEQWHATLQAASSGGKPPVLLDARNVYETRIGHFQAEGVELLDPQLRQFSELPHWMRANAQRLEGRKVLMYCTGGVRCERASALLKTMGPGFQDVCQLTGGIQRYIERFVDGGYFKGKNFVFDERVAVPPPAAPTSNAVGACLLCKAACDSYKPRLRCSSCRLLILVCPDCEVQDAKRLREVECELCESRKGTCQPGEAATSRPASSRKLKILCLHGFRQDARLMQDSLAKFQASAADLVHLEFAEAPHTLPWLYRQDPDPGKRKELPEIDPSRPRRAWLLEPAQAALAQADKERWTPVEGEASSDSYNQQTAGWPETWNHLQSVLRTRGPFDGLLGFSQGAAVAAAVCATLQQQRTKGCSGHELPNEPLSVSQSMPGEAQLATHLAPSNGESRHEACHVPMDGGLGKTQDLEKERVNEGCSSLHFVILASGFLSRAPENVALHKGVGQVDIPSLHVYVQEEGGRRDRQIPWEESNALEAWFSDRGKVALQHSKGHYLPADKASQAAYRSFLQDFL